MTHFPENSKTAGSKLNLIRIPRSSSREEKKAKLIEALANVGLKTKKQPDQDGIPENGSVKTCGNSEE